MNTSENGQKNTSNLSTEKTPTERPNKGLEDWELLQNKEEPPLKIPYWLPIIIAGLFICAILLSFPLTGVRDGYERPWLDSGIAIGVAYGMGSLLVIYLFLRARKKSKTNLDTDNIDKTD